MTSSNYPRAAFVLLAMTFFEAGAFAVFIVLNPSYWRESIGAGEKTADDANFSYGFLLNFTPLLTAFLADNYLGRYAMLLIHSIAFLLGFLLVSGSTVLSFPISGILGAFALICISTAVGINKVILPTFTADQFAAHNDEARNKIFSWYYMLCNLGSILAMQGVGSLKDYFTCFGKPCYIFVFGLCTGMVLISAGLFIGFSKCFVRAKMSKNVLVEAVKCVIVALRHKKQMKNENEKIENLNKRGLLDYVIPVYGQTFVTDLRQSLKVASLFFIGIPYWTCYQTMFGGWSRQYSMVDGRIWNFKLSFINFMAIDPVIVVLSIFLQNTLIIPMLQKCFKVTPLKKMVAGALAATISFACVIGVEHKLSEDKLPFLPTGAQVALWQHNSLPKDCQFHLLRNKTVVSLQNFNGKANFQDIETGSYKAMYVCNFPQNITKLQKSIDIVKGINLITLYPSESGNLLLKYSVVENERFANGLVENHIISCMANDKIKISPISEACQGETCKFTSNPSQLSGARIFTIEDSNCFAEKTKESGSIIAVKGYGVTGIWMWPQILMFALSESLLAVGALEFAYTQTSTSMKAFMQALWLFTAALGNVLGFFLNQLQMQPLVSHYVNMAIMSTFTLMFIVAVYQYKYVEIEEEPEEKMDNCVKVRDA